jgi:plasmid stabilization system protein ParE
MTGTARVVFHTRAAEDAAAIDLWWTINRRAAPDLFRQELEEVVTLVASSPTLGRAADTNDDDFPGVRRVLMRRTRYHVYYRVVGEVLEVLAIWHGARGEGPMLR